VVHRPRPGYPALRLLPCAALAVLLVLPLVAGAGVVSVGGTHFTPASVTGSAKGDVEVQADGHPTAGAGSVSSAVLISLSTPVNVTFQYATPGGAGPGLSVAVARLQLIVFDVPAGVKEVDLSNVHPATSGTVSVIGDYTYAKYLIEGAYELHALLLDPNGSTLFSETFFINVHEPYDLTVVTVIFGLLILYELYAVATLGSAQSVTKLVKAAEEARKGGPGAEP
jgi:hypothetical protein